MFIWNERDLNPEQADAIRTEGSVFLIACPGSGKTRTLTYKIALELSKIRSSKKFVVAITYTHRAADEIHERIENLGVETSQLWIGTIHSFCLEWIIKPYFIYHQALSRGYKVINSHDSENLLTELCQSHPGWRLTYWDCGYYFTQDGFVLSSQEFGKHQNITTILNEYFAILTERRQIDFELILYYAWQLVEAKSTISRLLANIFEFVLIDEYQDTKAIQYSIVASILKAGQGRTKTFIVGDPNQAIYESLGGFPIAPNVFKNDAQIELTELALSKNYRSSEKIISYFSNYNYFQTTIEPASDEKNYPSLISFNNSVTKDLLEVELVRCIRHAIETLGTAQREVCVLAPQWAHLAGMTRRLVVLLPEYSFNGPGMVPFARDVDNFWYKLSRIVLTEASPIIYVRRIRWANEIVKDLASAGVDTTRLSAKILLRECNSITLAESDGLLYLSEFFDALFLQLGIDFRVFPSLIGHHEAFFESSLSRIDALQKNGGEFISHIDTFRKVFQNNEGITVSTIHGVKGAEFDVVIAFALLEGMVPHFNAVNKEESAKKLLYVVCSRARKNLHLISESGRPRGRFGSYSATEVLAACAFHYDVLP